MQRPIDGFGTVSHRSDWIFVTDEAFNHPELISHILDDGRIEFPIAASSQRGLSENPIVRTGFAIFG